MHEPTMRMTIARRLALALALTLALAAGAACAPAKAPPEERTATAKPTATDADTAATTDTATIVVSGPTLVAFFPSNTKARVDADSTGSGISTAIDDLMYYLGSAQDTLAARGVTVHVKITDTLAFATTGPNARRWRWAPARDSSEIGYYLVRPDRPAQVLYGVQVNERLVDIVARYMGAGAGAR